MYIWWYGYRYFQSISLSSDNKNSLKLVSLSVCRTRKTKLNVICVLDEKIPFLWRNELWTSWRLQNCIEDHGKGYPCHHRNGKRGRTVKTVVVGIREKFYYDVIVKIFLCVSFCLQLNNCLWNVSGILSFGHMDVIDAAVEERNSSIRKLLKFYEPLKTLFP